MNGLPLPVPSQMLPGSLLPLWGRRSSHDAFLQAKFMAVSGICGAPSGHTLGKGMSEGAGAAPVLPVVGEGRGLGRVSPFSALVSTLIYGGWTSSVPEFLSFWPCSPLLYLLY